MINYNNIIIQVNNDSENHLKIIFDILSKKFKISKAKIQDSLYSTCKTINDKIYLIYLIRYSTIFGTDEYLIDFDLVDKNPKGISEKCNFDIIICSNKLLRKEKLKRILNLEK